MVNEWDNQYKLGKHDCIFPFSDLVSCVYKYIKPFPGMKVLELGCGTGANIPLFQHLAADYYAVEGSSAAVDTLRRRYPQYAGKVAVGDFTKSLIFEAFNIKFDLVIDRSVLTHNTTEEIERTIKRLHDNMNISSHYIGIDWFSISHSDFDKASRTIDDNTFDGFVSGQFKDVGKVHFSTEPHLKNLFKDFTIKMLEYKVILDLYNNRVATYNIVAKKI